MMGSRMFAGYGRCCRIEVAVISRYCILGRWFPPPWMRGTRNFTQPNFPTGVQTQVHGLSQFHRQIDVSILFVDVTRDVAEKSEVNG